MKPSHGHNREGKETPTHISWRAMRQRCMNPNHRAYLDYGGRGIVVDSRWDLFENFLADMGERPEGHTLDRKETNGNYTKDNCKWEVCVEQLRNRRPFKRRNQHSRGADSSQLQPD